MSELFTPQGIISEIMAVVPKNGNGYKRLVKLMEDIGYAAPEIRDARFWGSPNVGKDSITSICQDYFDNNAKVHEIYCRNVVKYELKKGFIYKEDLNTSRVSN